MGYGPPKVRRRTTAVIQQVPVVMDLSDTQKTALITFYDTTLEGGVLPFDWIDQLNGGTVEFAFMGPIAWAKPSGIWFASMQFEILP